MISPVTKGVSIGAIDVMRRACAEPERGEASTGELPVAERKSGIGAVLGRLFLFGGRHGVGRRRDAAGRVEAMGLWSGEAVIVARAQEGPGEVDWALGSSEARGSGTG